MKKLLILLSVVLLALLTSCGSSESDDSNTAGNTTTENSASTSEATKQDVRVVKKGDIVELHYKGTLEDGTQFDSSYDRKTPLSFTVGAGQMIPGFDAGVVGMSVGEKKSITIAPKDGYGEYEEGKEQVFNKKDLETFKEAGFKLVVGEKIPTQGGSLEIVKADEETITLNSNHPLAGKKLKFDIELLNIKDAANVDTTTPEANASGAIEATVSETTTTTGTTTTTEAPTETTTETTSSTSN